MVCRCLVIALCQLRKSSMIQLKTQLTLKEFLALPDKLHLKKSSNKQ
ncbi:hypothetical protein [Nostoc sp. 'Peltigera membranacea cyanobiont' 210A]|nr:hypothetical protein [Nostoc sp. 'Peltigera membranacea cyanobiont' 210A]